MRPRAQAPQGPADASPWRGARRPLVDGAFLAAWLAFGTGCYRSTVADDGGPEVSEASADVGRADAGPTDAGAIDDARDVGADVRPPCYASPEICNGIDDDCDGLVDEEPEASTWCGARCGVDECPRARPIRPLASELLTTRRPTFRWALVGGADSARVEVCRDRACSASIATATGTTSATITSDLPRGVVFWRLVARRAGRDLPAASTPWVARLPNVSVSVDGATGNVLDVDADGRADLVIDRFSPVRVSNRYLLYNGTTDHLVGRATLPDSVVSLLATLDVDGDGRADALTGERSGLAVRQGAPLGWLGSPLALPPSIYFTSARSAGDVDADGYSDLFFFPDQIARGGPGGVEPVTLTVPAPPYAQPMFGSVITPVGDIDADGIADFLAYQPCRLGGIPGSSVVCATDRALWRIRGGVAGFAAAERWAHVPLDSARSDGDTDNAWPIATGDVDGDGLLDLVARRYHAQPLLMLARDAAPNVDRWAPIDSDATVAWVGPACDLDGDGAGDLVLSYQTELPPHARETFLRRGGPGGLRPERTHLTNLVGAASRCLGDDDGDGLSEIAVLLYDPAVAVSYVVHVYRGAPGGIDTTPVQVIAVGDVQLSAARAGLAIF